MNHVMSLRAFQLSPKRFIPIFLLLITSAVHVADAEASSCVAGVHLDKVQIAKLGFMREAKEVFSGGLNRTELQTRDGSSLARVKGARPQASGGLIDAKGREVFSAVETGYRSYEISGCGHPLGTVRWAGEETRYYSSTFRALKGDKSYYKGKVLISTSTGEYEVLVDFNAGGWWPWSGYELSFPVRSLPAGEDLGSITVAMRRAKRRNQPASASFNPLKPVVDSRLLLFIEHYLVDKF